MHSLNYPEDECRVFLSLDKNNQTHELEAEVQKYATTVSTVRSVIEAVVPAILSCFLGVWSDTHGRKPLVVWPLFGKYFNNKHDTFSCRFAETTTPRAMIINHPFAYQHDTLYKTGYVHYGHNQPGFPTFPWRIKSLFLCTVYCNRDFLSLGNNWLQNRSP